MTQPGGIGRGRSATVLVWVLVGCACVGIVAAVFLATRGHSSHAAQGRPSGTDASSTPSPVQPRATATPSATTRGGRTNLRPGSHRVVTAQPARAAHSSVNAERPDRVRLPNGKVVPVAPASTGRNGTLNVPENIQHAGWWDGGSKIGDPYGAIGIAGHVDSFTQGLGPFSVLLSLHRGDVVRLWSRHLRQDYAVDSIRTISRNSVPSTTAAFSVRGAARLVLITCAPPYEPSHGGYQDLAIISARPRGHLHVDRR